MSFNKAILVGRAKENAVRKVGDSGDPMCFFDLETNDSYTDQNGQEIDRKESHRILMFGKRVDAYADRITKDRQIYIAGKMQTRVTQDDYGNRNYFKDILAFEVKFLD